MYHEKFLIKVSTIRDSGALRAAFHQRWSPPSVHRIASFHQSTSPPEVVGGWWSPTTYNVFAEGDPRGGHQPATTSPPKIIGGW
jgi:hypothetical protein